MPPRAKGHYIVKRQRAKKTTTATSISYTIPFVGPYNELEASEPIYGSGFSGFSPEFRVREVSLEDTGGGTGKMLVTVSASFEPNENGPSQIGVPIYESDYAEERRPIEENKKCGFLKPNRPGYDNPNAGESSDASNLNKKYPSSEAKGRQRTWDHWAALNDDDYDASGSEKWTLAQYKALKEKGRNDYPVNYPICTATTYYRYRPVSGSAVNTISTPPSDCNPPAGYIYVKCADKCTKQGRIYTRVQAWRGYDSTESLFYL
jgi:hypothetical protein